METEKEKYKPSAVENEHRRTQTVPAIHKNIVIHLYRLPGFINKFCVWQWAGELREGSKTPPFSFNNRARSVRKVDISFSYAHFSSVSNTYKTYLSANYKYERHHMRNHSNKQKTSPHMCLVRSVGQEWLLTMGPLAKCASSFEVSLGTTHCTVRMAAVVKFGYRHFEPTVRITA